MFKNYFFVIDLETRNRNSDLNLLSAQKMTSVPYSEVLTKSNNIDKELLVLLQKITSRNSTGTRNSFSPLKRKQME